MFLTNPEEGVHCDKWGFHIESSPHLPVHWSVNGTFRAQDSVTKLVVCNPTETQGSLSYAGKLQRLFYPTQKLGWSWINLCVHLGLLEHAQLIVWVFMQSNSAVLMFMIRSTACGKGGVTFQRNAVEASCIYIIILLSAYWFQKRKKNSYLTSGLPPPTRQLTRSLRAEPHREEKPPVPSVQESTAVPQQRTALPQTTAAGSLSLCIPGLPASLTIERIQRAVCVMCRKPGEWVGFSWLLWRAAEHLSVVASCLLVSLYIPFDLTVQNI